jgi:FAH family protein
MTILVLHNNYSFSALSEQSVSSSESLAMTYYTLPETALQRNGKPVFLPDYANPAQLEVHLAVRICRLGRHISARFASRYYDAATVIPHFIAPALWEKTQKLGLPWDAALGFDNATPLGEFVEIAPSTVSQLDFSLRVDGKEQMSGSTTQWLHHVDNVIAEVSQYFTLRRGDILLMGAPTAPIFITPDHKIETYLGETRVLSFNVK